MLKQKSWISKMLKFEKCSNLKIIQMEEMFKFENMQI
jgi:hypothetical protein